MADFPFDIVGFDLDGTLLDTREDLGAAINHALARAGRPPVPIEQVAGLIGGGSRTMLARALEVTGGPLPDGHVESLYEHLLDYYADHMAAHTRLYPGGEAMLDALASRGVKIAVVTNKLESLANQLFDSLGISARFATVIGGDTLGPGRCKPAPDQLHEMVARLGGGRAAYVGDTTYDTRAARAAGLPCVAVSFGFNDAPPRELGADRVIGHFDQLIPTLESL